MTPVMDLTGKLLKSETVLCPTLQRAHRGVALNQMEERLLGLKREAAKHRAMAGLTDIIADELSAAIKRQRDELEGV